MGRKDTFIGLYKPYDGEWQGYIYSGANAWKEWHEDTFSAEDYRAIPLWVSGRTYREKRSRLEHIANAWERTFSEYGISWSYGELMIVQDFLECNARRYGLATVFREVGLI